MAETTQTSDKSLGLSLTFSIVAVLATLGMLVTSYLYAANGDHQMQIYSGAAFGAAMLFGSLAIVALHVFSE